MNERFSHSDGFETPKNGSRGHLAKPPEKTKIEVAWNEEGNEKETYDISGKDTATTEALNINIETSLFKKLIDSYGERSERMKSALDQHRAVLRSLSDVEENELIVLRELDQHADAFNNLNEAVPASEEAEKEMGSLQQKIVVGMVNLEGFKEERRRISEVHTIVERAMVELDSEMQILHDQIMNLSPENHNKS